MAYTNSPMVVYTKLSPNHSGQRTHSIDRITPHCVVGQCSVETLGSIFAPSSRQASSNYGIGEDGRVGMYVEEKNRSWCSSSNANDQRAVTIECASDNTEPYAFKDVVYQKLIKLCVDICQRNGKKKLLWLGDKDTTQAYTPKADEMVLTVHRWFANKSCPGSWMYARMGDLASKVTAQLSGSKQEETPAVTDAEKTIWDFLHGKIGNAYGAAGMMGNLYADVMVDDASYDIMLFGSGLSLWYFGGAGVGAGEALSTRTRSFPQPESSRASSRITGSAGQRLPGYFMDSSNSQIICHVFSAAASAVRKATSNGVMAAVVSLLYHSFPRKQPFPGSCGRKKSLFSPEIPRFDSFSTGLFRSCNFCFPVLNLLFVLKQ